jgi:drug/metabolite transporter (DMT)-like permease
MRPPLERLTTTRPVSWKIGLVALIVSVFWSGNIVSIKVGLATIPPYWSAFWRMAVGAVAVAVWTRALGKPVLFRPDHLRQLLPLSAMFTVQIAVFNLSVFYTSPAYAVILLNTNPIMVNLISHFFVRDDHLTTARLLGLSIAFGGICYVMLGDPDASLAPDPLLGNALMLVSALLLATRIVYTQRMVQGMDPLRPVIWQMAFSLPGFVALALAFERPLLQPLGYEAVLAMLYQALVVAGICFVTWTALLQRHSAGNLAVYGFTVPIFGILLSAAIFDEQITGRLLGGAAAVAAGIGIVSRAKRGEKASAG